MKEKEVEETITRFRKIIGPVADTLATEAALEANVRIVNGKVESIDSESQYKELMTKMKGKYGRIIGSAVTETLMEG